MTYSCKDYRDREFLEKNFQINPEKGDPAIHPPRFCNSCFATHTQEHVYWEIHSDENCSTCSREEKAQKGGRPKKSKQEGRKHTPKTLDDTHKNTTRRAKTIKTVLKEKVTTLTESTASIQHPQFSDNFEFVKKRKDEFFCPICKDVLDIPIETV